MAYESVADVTTLVRANGIGAYRVSGVDGQVLPDLDENVTFAAWSLVVLYRDATQPPRNLAVFDGLDRIADGAPSDVTLSGFLVPNAGFTAKLGVITYEGDDQSTGDQLLLGPNASTLTALTDALNPTNNFFNSTRSTLGVATSVVGDLPQLTGAARTMASFDLDVVDITARVTAGQTSTAIRATSSQDVYFLGAFVTSISTFRPDFDTSIKTVCDVNGAAVVAGDELEYTLTIANTGNDASSNTVVTDALPSGVSYVANSITFDGNAAPDSDPRVDVVGNTLTLRLGTGANATQGGSIAIGGSVIVRFKVRVNAGVSGTLSNQAVINAGGVRGSPPVERRHDAHLQPLHQHLQRLHGRLAVRWDDARLSAERRLRRVFGEQHQRLRGQ